MFHRFFSKIPQWPIVVENISCHQCHSPTRLNIICSECSACQPVQSRQCPFILMEPGLTPSEQQSDRVPVFAAIKGASLQRRQHYRSWMALVHPDRANKTSSPNEASYRAAQSAWLSDHYQRLCQSEKRAGLLWALYGNIWPLSRGTALITSLPAKDACPVLLNTLFDLQEQLDETNDIDRIVEMRQRARVKLMRCVTRMVQLMDSNWAMARQCYEASLFSSTLISMTREMWQTREKAIMATVVAQRYWQGLIQSCDTRLSLLGQADAVFTNKKLIMEESAQLADERDASPWFETDQVWMRKGQTETTDDPMIHSWDD